VKREEGREGRGKREEGREKRGRLDKRRRELTIIQAYVSPHGRRWREGNMT
jgi:hypothetical protein